MSSSPPSPRPTILYVGPIVEWKSYLAAIKSEGLLAVACIAEGFKDGPMVDMTPFKALREDGGAAANGFEALIDHSEPYRILEQAKMLESLHNLVFVGVLRTSEPDTAVVDFVAAGLVTTHLSFTWALVFAWHGATLDHHWRFGFGPTLVPELLL
jgi:hypothetical protein